MFVVSISPVRLVQPASHSRPLVSRAKLHTRIPREGCSIFPSIPNMPSNWVGELLRPRVILGLCTAGKRYVELLDDTGFEFSHLRTKWRVDDLIIRSRLVLLYKPYRRRHT